jgi:hypothetical protein
MRKNVKYWSEAYSAAMRIAILGLSNWKCCCWHYQPEAPRIKMQQKQYKRPLSEGMNMLRHPKYFMSENVKISSKTAQGLCTLQPQGYQIDSVIAYAIHLKPPGLKCMKLEPIEHWMWPSISEESQIFFWMNMSWIAESVLTNYEHCNSMGFRLIVSLPTLSTWSPRNWNAIIWMWPSTSYKILNI